MDSKAVISSFRRFIVTRFRIKRWTTTLMSMLLLLLGTFLLVSFLPERESRRSFSPKLNALKDKSVMQPNELTIGASVVRNSDDSLSNDSDKPWLNYYGDRFAWYTPNTLGNFEPTEKKPVGRPGDEGKEYHIERENDVDMTHVNNLKSQYGMNIAASDRIPMDRSIPDLRLDECRHWNYGNNLPTASVVIVFHNEGFSTLMRTVHSVLLRSPRMFLREVVLVDDYSDKKPLGNHLDKYIIDNFGPYQEEFKPPSESEGGKNGETLADRSGKVKLVRNSERMGLINSRTRGAEAANGEVVVFLDAHCEVSYNWLTPLLAPIAKNSKTLTVPIIDGIDSKNFKYRPVYARADQHFKGIWEWGMYYKEQEVDMDIHLRSHKVSEPYDAPTHAGGLFAIQKEYFMELGGYDPGLLVWGGENFELSFKVWQCGGRLQWVPCSRVGHIYRDFMPYSFGSLASKRKGPLILTNYKRVIETWWDKEYKEYFYTREPLARFYDAGDITSQLAIRNRLQCKSFDWFMTNVASDVYKDFPKLPPNLFWGEVRHIESDRCLDTGSSAPPQTVHLSTCHSSGGHQLFRLNAKGQLGVGERCIEANRRGMTLVYCKKGTVDGPWTYNASTQQFKHGKLCLTFTDQTGVHLAQCDNSKPNQKWKWREIKP